MEVMPKIQKKNTLTKYEKFILKTLIIKTIKTSTPAEQETLTEILKKL